MDEFKKVHAKNSCSESPIPGKCATHECPICIFFSKNWKASLEGRHSELESKHRSGPRRRNDVGVTTTLRLQRNPAAKVGTSRATVLIMFWGVSVISRTRSCAVLHLKSLVRSNNFGRHWNKPFFALRVRLSLVQNIFSKKLIFHEIASKFGL